MKLPERVSSRLFSPLLVLQVLLMMASCQTAPYLTEKNLATQAAVRGMIFDWDRLPVAMATVTLERTDGSKVIIQSDIHGRYQFDPVPFGTLRLTAAKAGYEPTAWEFDFTEASLVSYSQLSNAEQLLEQAVAALETKEWESSRLLLERAKALDPQTPALAFLEAFQAASQGKTTEAIQSIEAWIASHRAYFSLEVYLADLYEHQGSLDQAALHWKKALSIKGDPLIEARLRESEAKGH